MALNADSVGSRVLGGGDSRWPPIAQRTHVSRRSAAELQSLRQQPRAGGLAVRSRDASHRQGLRWRAEETIRDQACTLTQLWNSGHKNTGTQLRCGRLGRVFVEHGARTEG